MSLTYFLPRCEAPFDHLQPTAWFVPAEIVNEWAIPHSLAGQLKQSYRRPILPLRLQSSAATAAIVAYVNIQDARRIFWWYIDFSLQIKW